MNRKYKLINEYQEPPFHSAQSHGFIRRWSVWVVPCRYTHDSSETLEDRLDLTATDGTNPVDFTLQVQVGRSSLRFKSRATACITFTSDWLMGSPNDLLMKRCCDTHSRRPFIKSRWTRPLVMSQEADFQNGL